MRFTAHRSRPLSDLARRHPDAEGASTTLSSVESSPSPTHALINTTVPKATQVLAVVLSVVFLIFIIGFVIWHFARRRRLRATPSLAEKVIIPRKHPLGDKIDLEVASINMEKSQLAVLTPSDRDTQAGWVPQIRSRAEMMPSPVPKSSTKTKGNPRARQQLFVRSPSFDIPITPPPAYINANDNSDKKLPLSIPLPPNLPISTIHPPTPPTPPANKAKMNFESSSAEIPPPTPSPRSESFAPHDFVPLQGALDASDGDHNELAKYQRLPRLMTVVTTFTPSLEDELQVKLGDTVRMLEEYPDGWCLAQRVGRIDARKGAVPRFCLQERRSMVSTPERSIGSFTGQSWR